MPGISVPLPFSPTLTFPLDSQYLKALGFTAHNYQRCADVGHFLLLRRIQELERFVPVVSTTATGEKESARRVLEQRASDLLIPTPSKQKQTSSTIRLALLHNKFRLLIASRDKVLERYAQHLTDYPGDRRGVAFRKILTSIEESLSAHEQTIHQIETSLKRFPDLAKTVENQTREGALERLDSL